MTFNERKLLQLLAAGDFLIFSDEAGWKLRQADLQVAPYAVAALLGRGYIIVSPGSQTARISAAGQQALAGEYQRVAA